MVWHIRECRIRGGSGVETQPDSKECETDEGDNHIRRTVKVVSRIPIAVIAQPIHIGFRAPNF